MTSLNIVAHPDDDLLFLNPDILEDSEKGLVYIVYLTLGDDGKDARYYGKRMLAVRHAWEEKVFTIQPGFHSNSFRNNDLMGDLYRAWSYPELEIYSAWDTHEWNGPEILEWLRDFIESTKPDVIRTHDPDVQPAIDHDESHLDHIDHIYTAKFVQEAAKSFPLIPVYSYMGYPIRHQMPNLSEEQVSRKTELWRRYQELDTEAAGEIWDIAMSRCYNRRIQ